MNNVSLLQSSVWARAFLVAAWLLPCLAILINTSMNDTGLMPPSVGYLDSGRTLLTLLCLLGFLFSGSRLAPSSGAGRLTMVFLGWSALSCLLNESPFDSFLFWQMWPAAVLFFLAARRFQLQTLSASVRAALLHLPVTLVAVMALLPILYEPAFFRIGGVFGLAGVLATWLLFLLPLSLYDTLEAKGVEAWVAGLASCSSLAAIAFTFSRASWFLACLQLAFALLLLAPFDRRRFSLISLWTLVGIGTLIAFRQSFSTFLWAGALVAVPVLPVAVETAASRIKPRYLLKIVGLLLLTGLVVFGLSKSESMQTAGQMTDARLSKLKQFDNSSRARIELWRVGLVMARAHPFFGVGPGDYSVHYPRFQEAFYYYSDSAHCAALEMASEVGFVGLALFVVALISLLRKETAAPLEPVQRVALLALVCGLAYAQIDVAYQIGYLWLTVAMLFLHLLPRPEHPEPKPSRVTTLQVALGVVTVAFASYVLPPIRQVEASRSAEPQRALDITGKALKRLPIWRHALLTNYQLQMQLDGPMPSALQTERLLDRGSSLATSHALVGEWHLQEGRPKKAVEQYQKALEIDPHNHPYFYTKLRSLGIELSDKRLAESAERTLLEKYSPEKVALAHQGHRAGLQAQLVPVLFDIADGMNPYRQPLKTMPIYRYIYSLKPSPRAAYGLGISLQSLGRTKEARPYLEEAHRDNPLLPAPESPSE